VELPQSGNDYLNFAFYILIFEFLMPTVTIDGRKVSVKKDATVLDAAKKAGVWIPTLCYNPAVSSDASCRLCMV
jgi:predicted molibdopterin-dependent oxidoreductase YjgC